MNRLFAFTRALPLNPALNLIGRNAALFRGALAALILLLVLTPVWNLLGTNPSFLEGVVLAGALIIFWANRIAGRTSRQSWSRVMALPLAACWAVVSIRLLLLFPNLLSRVPVSALTQPGASLALIFLCATFCLGPAILLLLLSRAPVDNPPSRLARLWDLGFALGVLLLPSLVLAKFAGSVLLLAAFFIEIILRGLEYRADRNALEEIPSEAKVEPHTISRNSDEPLPNAIVEVMPDASWTRSVQSGVCLLCGAGLALLAFIDAQLVTQTLMTDLWLFSGLLFGVLVAPLLDRLRKSDVNPRVSPWSPLALATTLAVFVFGYPLWIGYCLRITAWVSNLQLLFALRALLIAGFAFPIGLVLGQTFHRFPASATRTSHRQWPWLFVAAGFVLARVFPWSPQWASIGIIVAALLLTVAAVVTRGTGWVPRSRLGRLAGSAAILTAVAGVCLTSQLQFDLSERLLFSSRTFAALRQGVPANQLAWTGDGRQIAEFQTLRDRVSLWRHHGSQLLSRTNGVISELRSANVDVCPHSASEILPALLPLVVHSQAEHVLVLGMHVPTLESCHAYPLRSVTTVEASAASDEMLRWLSREGLWNPQSEIFETMNADPATALNFQFDRKYDLIISPLAQNLTTQAPAQFTQEFYRQIARHLQTGGIYCQRTAYFDLGPDLVRQIAATMRSVFPRLLVVESVPGELLWLMSDDQGPLLSKEMVQRLQAPQTRLVLGQSGWDWSVVMGRGSLRFDAVEKLIGNSQPISLAESQISYAVPVEVSRWGNKAEATRHSLAQYGQALGGFLEEGEETKEISERLDDIRLAHQIQVEQTDQPWAYRSAIRDRLKERPRAVIQQVSHEGLKQVRHPEDQRRMQYLKALGHVATQSHPSARDVEQLEAFAVPFDPLVSVFVYHEMSRLSASTSEADPELRLNALLHTVYHATADDVSVRNVCEAIGILCEQPGRELECWDHLNALLEVLEQRWAKRLNSGKVSRYESLDAEKSLDAIEVACAELGELHHAAGLTDAQWQLRKDVLDSMLLRPLRQHRSRLTKMTGFAPSSLQRR